MNNEFNNPNMNQFENNNMNSQYANNYNNLDDQNNNNNDKWKDTLILVLVIIVFILTALSLYFIIDKKDNEIDRNDQNNQQENENTNDVNVILSETEITKYLKKVPFLEGNLYVQSKNEIYDDAYVGKNININEINASILLYSAIINTEAYDFKDDEFGNFGDAYKVSDINLYLKKTYNIDNLTMPKHIKVPGGEVNLYDDYYLKTMHVGATGYRKEIYSTKYYIENASLVIEEEILFFTLGLPLEGVEVYANTSDMHKESDAIDTFNLDYTLDNNISLKDYTNKTPTKYKHTYKKINNEYVWYSTEVVK